METIARWSSSLNYSISLSKTSWLPWFQYCRQKSIELAKLCLINFKNQSLKQLKRESSISRKLKIRKLSRRLIFVQKWRNVKKSGSKNRWSKKKCNANLAKPSRRSSVSKQRWKWCKKRSGLTKKWNAKMPWSKLRASTTPKLPPSLSLMKIERKKSRMSLRSRKRPNLKLLCRRRR